MFYCGHFSIAYTKIYNIFFPAGSQHIFSVLFKKVAETAISKLNEERESFLSIFIQDWIIKADDPNLSPLAHMLALVQGRVL